MAGGSSVIRLLLRPTSVLRSPIDGQPAQRVSLLWQ